MKPAPPAGRPRGCAASAALLIQEGRNRQRKDPIGCPGLSGSPPASTPPSWTSAGRTWRPLNYSSISAPRRSTPSWVAPHISTGMISACEQQSRLRHRVGWGPLVLQTRLHPPEMAAAFAPGVVVYAGTGGSPGIIDIGIGLDFTASRFLTSWIKSAGA